MFTIADGRDHFYQWDLNRQIIVSDPTVDEVHFCNKTDDCSLVLEVEEEVLAERLDGTKVIQRYVNVPNILLQDALPIRVYAFCVDYTKVEKIFKVCPRTRPADYIYEETEIKRWEDTVNKAEETLDRANEVLDGANDIALQAKEHADNASTSASNALESAANANESETNAATSASNASKSATDALSNANKAKASELNAQAAALDAVAAKEDVFEKLEGFDEKVESVNTNAQIASESATSAANTVEGFNEYVEGHKLEFTHDGNGAVTLEGVELNDLDEYALKSEIPTKVSVLENDAGYLTSLPEHTHDQYLTEHQDLSEYAKKTEIPSLDPYALKTELPSTEGLATEDYVDTAINNIPTPSGGLEIVTIFEGPESPAAGREYTTTENIKYYVVLCGDTSLASGAAFTHFVPANSTDIRFITDPSTQVAIKYNGSPNSLKIVSGSRIKIHYVFGFK